MDPHATFFYLQVHFPLTAANMPHKQAPVVAVRKHSSRMCPCVINILCSQHKQELITEQNKEVF